MPWSTLNRLTSASESDVLSRSKVSSFQWA